MDITKISLNQSADALWIPVDHIPPKGIGGGEQRHFSTLTDAVLFIMGICRRVIVARLG
jgi:hypothetical protein